MSEPERIIYNPDLAAILADIQAAYMNLNRAVDKLREADAIVRERGKK